VPSCDDDFLYLGKGGDHPRIKSVLSELSDKIVSKCLPGYLQNGTG
jgi:hypothetical protein